MAGNKPCGEHTELASNNAVRVTRCSCGTLHVTMQQNGVTVRMSADALRNTWAGLRAAMDRMDEQVPSLGSSIIN